MNLLDSFLLFPKSSKQKEEEDVGKSILTTGNLGLEKSKGTERKMTGVYKSISQIYVCIYKTLI